MKYRACRQNDHGRPDEGVWPIVVRKTIIIGSTEGDVAGPDREEKVELNVYRMKRGLQKWRLSPSLIATE